LDVSAGGAEDDTPLWLIFFGGEAEGWVDGWRGCPENVKRVFGLVIFGVEYFVVSKTFAL
jgi:hypothetical protein